jgi:hypothetical protein
MVRVASGLFDEFSVGAKLTYKPHPIELGVYEESRLKPAERCNSLLSAGFVPVDSGVG